MTLLDAVDELTLPKYEHHAQKDHAGKWLRAVTVTLPPLLQRLDDAVHPSGNKDAGSASTKATRALVNVNALFEFSKMSAAISSWCRIRGLRPRKNAVADLRAWYASTLAENFDGTWHVRELKRWEVLIRDLLEPGKTFEVHAPCVVCGATEWGDMIRGGSLWALQITYRWDEETGRMNGERAMCRACETVWSGHSSVMELAEEIGQKITEATA